MRQKWCRDQIRLEPMGSAEFVELRRRLGLGQTEFARRYGVPLTTVMNWEREARIPGAATLAYLTVIARDPERVAAVLAGATAEELRQLAWRELRAALDAADRRERPARGGGDAPKPRPEGSR